MKAIFPVCYDPYSKEDEDTTPYNKPGWILVENSTKKEELNRLCPKPWRYQRPAETDTVSKWGQFALYPGGGFMADLGYDKKIGISVIESLENHGWLDLQSRSVILEFSAFSPPTNLLVVATYFYEIQPTGFKAPFERIKIISMYSKESGSHQFYLICILLFMVFVLLYMGRICNTVYKQRLRFFKFFWNWVEILQVIFSVLAVVMNIARSCKAVSALRKMKENIYANVSFQEVIVWTEAENGILGILALLVTLKLLRLIRFNEHVAVLSRTLKASASLLWSFMAVFLIAFMAFMHFGMLIFGTGSEKYSSVLKATYFQLELCLGRVKARPINELSDANSTFGRVFSSFLLLTLTIVFMNFFIAAINDALSDASKSVVRNELYDLVDESSSNNEKRNKMFFDAISKLIKQTTINDKFSVFRNKQREKKSKKSGYSAAVDFDLISKTFVASRQKESQDSKQKKKESTRRKSLYDKVSDAVKQLRRKQFTRDVVKYEIKNLRRKEKHLFQRLDNIVQADYEEEDSLHLLLHQL